MVIKKKKVIKKAVKGVAKKPGSGTSFSKFVDSPKRKHLDLVSTDALEDSQGGDVSVGVAGISGIMFQPEPLTTLISRNLITEDEARFLLGFPPKKTNEPQTTAEVQDEKHIPLTNEEIAQKQENSDQYENDSEAAN